MDIPTSEKEILEYVRKEHESVLTLHKELNADYVSHLKDNIIQRRDFYKNLVALCGVLLGFMPLFFERVGIEHIKFFVISVTLLFVTIILIINYIRSIIDLEGNEFRKQLKEYNDILNPQIKMRQEFFSKGVFTQEELKNLFIKMRQLSESQIDILKKREFISKEKEKLIRMDYAGECFIYLFVLSVMFLTLSLIKIDIEWFLIVLIGALLIIPVFFFPSSIFVYIGYPIEYVSKIISKK